MCRLLVYRFLDVPEFQNVTLKCLTVIADISKESTRDYHREYVELFRSTIEQLKKIIPVDYDLRKAYATGQDAQQVLTLEAVKSEPQNMLSSITPFY